MIVKLILLIVTIIMEGSNSKSKRDGAFVQTGNFRIGFEMVPEYYKDDAEMLTAARSCRTRSWNSRNRTLGVIQHTRFSEHLHLNVVYRMMRVQQ